MHGLVVFGLFSFVFLDVLTDRLERKGSLRALGALQTLTPVPVRQLLFMLFFLYVRAAAATAVAGLGWSCVCGPLNFAVTFVIAVSLEP